LKETTMMATRSQQTQRRTGIKSCIDMEDSRRKREEQTNGLRKNKREESLQKRRNFGAESAPSSPVVSSLHPHATSTTGSSSSSATSTANDMNRLHDLVAGLASDDFMHVLDCTTRIRKLLSVKHNPPIDAVIQAGSIPRLLHLLSLVGHPQIQFEACWALTNVASGSLDQTMAVVNANAIPLFCQLLEVPSADVREQALWALANIAGENPQLRDLVLGYNAVELTILQFTGNPVSDKPTLSPTLPALSDDRCFLLLRASR
jgi:importin subunit alpha-1